MLGKSVSMHLLLAKAGMAGSAQHFIHIETVPAVQVSDERTHTMQLCLDHMSDGAKLKA